MKGYKELSEEIRYQKLQELQFAEVKYYGQERKEASLAGKIRTRPVRSGVGGYGSSLIAGHTEYTSARKLRNAASNGTFEEVLNLLRRGANVKKADSKGRTALHFASSRGESEIVQILIRYGAVVNERDCNGSTPLHLACCTNHTSVVTSLLKAGTDVNALDTRGATPLHLAYSRLRLARESDDKGGEALSRKSEMCGMVEMLKEYLHVTKSNKDETEELEELAGRLSLSETSEQVNEIQGLLEGFTSLSIERRKLLHEKKKT